MLRIRFQYKKMGNNWLYFAGLQGSLADYNLLIDLMNTDTEKMEIDEECQELTQQNQVRDRL